MILEERAIRMGDAEQETRMGYHALYDDKNTDIVTALINEAPEDVKPVLEAYNVNKLHSDYKKEITQDNTKEVLLAATVFLKVQPRNKHIGSITKAIVLGVQNFLHELCENCKEYYTVPYHDTPSLRCQNCGQGCHEACYGMCKHLPGIEWSCSSCNVSGIQAKEKSDDQEVGEEVVEVESTPPANDEHKDSENIHFGEDGYPESFQRPPPSQKQKPSDDQNEREPDPKVDKPMCKFFQHSRCKHGISGKDCKYRHEPVCGKFLRNGNKGRYGCNKGSNCSLFHPKMCWDSMNYRICKRENCKFMHIKGTNKPGQSFIPSQDTVEVWDDRNRQSAAYNQPNHPPPNQLPATNQPQNHKSDSFLDMMMEMRKQLQDIQSYQQQLTQGYQYLKHQISQPQIYQLPNNQVIVPQQQGHQAAPTQQGNL